MSSTTPARKLRHAIKLYLDALRRSGVPLEYTHYPGGPNGRKGEPDMHVTCRGRSCWFELKTGSDRLSEIQQHRLDNWRRAGAVAGEVRSVEDVKELLGDVREHF